MTNETDLTGKSVVVRARDAGVHFGILSGYEGRTVTLTNSRRLWRWHARSGVALSGVAQHGIFPDKSKVDSAVPVIVVLDACEIIAASDIAAKTIREA